MKASTYDVDIEEIDEEEEEEEEELEPKDKLICDLHNVHIL
jgi:predicted KAP-like P-loop ATPase